MAIAADIETIYELSPAQHGILVHLLRAPASGMYCEQMTFELPAALDVATFERAWSRIVARHGALRTSFHWEDIDKPLQVVHRDADLPVTELDWRTLSAAEQRSELERHLSADRERGFVLSEAPLMRVALIRLANERWQVVITFSHVILDGWSLQLLFGELDAIYRGLLAGAPPALPEPRPFADYIAFLHERDEREGDEFWTGVLRGVTEPTPLPEAYLADEDAPPQEGVHEQALMLSADATRGLEALARDARVSLNTIISGAWAMLLGRFAYRHDVVYGAVVSGRPPALEGVEAMVGMFVATVPMRVRLRPDVPLSSWLRELQASQAEAQDHAHTPLTEIQRCSEMPSGAPLFESLVAFQNYPRAGGRAESDGGPPAVRAFTRTNYPLALAVALDRVVTLRLLHERERLDDRTARDLLRRLETLLGEMAAKPEPLAELALQTARERARLLEISWGPTPEFGPEPLHVLFAAQVAQRPEATAFRDGAHTVTYAALDRAAALLADRLSPLIDEPEARIGVVAQRSLTAVIAVLGVVKAGACYVPLDPAHPEQRLRQMIDDAGVTAVVTSEAYRDRLPTGCPHVVDVPDVPPAGDGPAHPGAPSGDRALAYVMYTSGSTGVPKGIAVEHRAVKRVTLQTDYIALGPGDRVAMMSNFSFDAATFEIWGALLNGATLVCIAHEETLDPTRLATVLRKQEVTSLFMTSALFSRIAAEAPWAFGGVRDVLVGGEVLDAAAMRAVLETAAPERLVNVYGPTETTTFASWWPTRRIPARMRTVPIGRPIANTELLVLDRFGQLAPTGAIGELHIGGLGLARGYHNRPDLTNTAFIPHPHAPHHRLYRTGDLARHRPDGNLEFRGRIDDQLKLRGFRIEPGEIETTLNTHPNIRETAVILREDRPGDRRLTAYIVPTHPPAPTDTELRTHAQQHLPDFMIPSAIIALDHLPLNANGKLDRHALPAPNTTHPHPDSYTAPTTDTQHRLATIWQDVLGLNRVGIHDNFFAVGGNSLLATKLISRTRQAFATELPLARLFEAPTIADMAEAVDRLRDTALDEPGDWEEGAI